jgi:hypothetical protein
MQFFIDFSNINIATNCIVLASSLTTLFYFRYSKALITHPLSGFSLLGFCVTTQLGALLAQSFTWLSLVYNLRQPIVTFGVLAIYQIIALFAHIFFRIITTKDATTEIGIVRYTFQKLGIYETPSVIHLWIMGGFGIFFLLLAHISPIANGFSFLAWAPFLIPIYVQQIGPNYCNAAKNYLCLIAFASLIGLMALAFNARGLMLSGFATVALIFLLAGMRSNNKITFKMLSKFSFIGLICFALSWPASNMVTAMVIARKERGRVDIFQMVSKTWDNFLDPDKLNEYNKQVIVSDLRSAYDETYIANPMVARFVTTKFHDNGIYFAGKIEAKGTDELTKVSEDFFWYSLPQPWLDYLKIDVKKDQMGFSIGDVMANLVVGTPLGGERTGSIYGQGWVLFGYYFPIIYFFMGIALFAAIDIFALQTVSGVTILSVIGMLNLWPNFLFGITADSIHHLFNSVVRGVLQSVALYAFMFSISKGLAILYLNFFKSTSTDSLESKSAL